MLTKQAYDLLVGGWGVDGDHDLTSVADALGQGDREMAVKKLEQQIAFATARLRAYIALRSALVMQDASALEALRDKDITDIADWLER